MLRPLRLARWTMRARLRPFPFPLLQGAALPGPRGLSRLTLPSQSSLHSLHTCLSHAARVTAPRSPLTAAAGAHDGHASPLSG
eukprot:6503269-Prymnesium_polylepis.1